MKNRTLGTVLLVIASITVWFSLPRKEPVQPADATMTMQEIKVTSGAFQHNGIMPEKFTCDADNASPPLEIVGVPKEAKSLALIMHDHDAPRAGGWTHWVKWNMSWNMKYGTWSTEEGKEPEGTSGIGTGGELTYQGPCPPSGTHRYFFTVHALDVELSLKEGSTKTELESAMQGHILGEGELIGLYARK